MKVVRLALLFTLFLNFSLCAQIQSIKFDDGTYLDFSVLQENPRIAPRFFGTLDMGPQVGLAPYDGIQLGFQLRSSYAINPKTLVRGYFNIIPNDVYLNNTSLGAYYSLTSYLGSSNSKLALKAETSAGIQKRYYYETDVKHLDSWDLYLGYSHRHATTDGGLSRANLISRWDSARAGNYTSFKDPSFSSHSIDIGFSFSRQKNFNYQVNNDKLSYYSKFLSTFKVHIPFAQIVSGTFTYREAGSAEREEFRYNVDLLTERFRPIGFSLDTEFLGGRGAIGGHYSRNLGLEIGLYPFLENQSAFIRIYTGLGYRS